MRNLFIRIDKWTKIYAQFIYLAKLTNMKIIYKDTI